MAGAFITQHGRNKDVGPIVASNRDSMNTKSQIIRKIYVHKTKPSPATYVMRAMQYFLPEQSHNWGTRWHNYCKTSQAWRNQHNSSGFPITVREQTLHKRTSYWSFMMRPALISHLSKYLTVWRTTTKHLLSRLVCGSWLSQRSFVTVAMRSSGARQDRK